MRRLIPLLVALACCGGERSDVAPAATNDASSKPGVLAPAASAPTVAAVEWIDPEPSDAQARAEEVVRASSNADKITPLTMGITTLVDRRSGIAGFASVLAARELPVDERLDRLGAKVSEHEIVITLSGSVLFDFDKAEIRPDAERTLAEVAEVLDAYRDRPVRVEGHTDSIASDSYNQALSERRARAVAAWLTARGAPAARMSTAGLGESRPVGDNATPAGRQQNRRVEIVIGTAP